MRVGLLHPPPQLDCYNPIDYIPSHLPTPSQDAACEGLLLPEPYVEGLLSILIPAILVAVR